MAMKKLVAVLAFAMVSCFYACQEEPCSLNPTRLTLDLPDQPYNYIAVNNDVATLGRVLFYDTRLSVNNAISCASCHKQSIAFSDNVALSRGFENRLTSRNSLPIQNLGSVGFGFPFGSPPSLFWDGREQFL